MYIEYKFKVNSYSLEKGVISVSYIPVDDSLGLKPHHVQQLGIDKDLMLNYANGSITVDQFKADMRKAIINADGIAQHAWNEKIAASAVVIPSDVDSMIGVEWPAVSESESGNEEYSEVVL